MNEAELQYHKKEKLDSPIQHLSTSYFQLFTLDVIYMYIVCSPTNIVNE